MSTWYTLKQHQKLHNRGNISKPILQCKTLLHNRGNQFETIRLCNVIILAPMVLFRGLSKCNMVREVPGKLPGNIWGSAGKFWEVWEVSRSSGEVWLLPSDTPPLLNVRLSVKATLQSLCLRWSHAALPLVDALVWFRNSTEVKSRPPSLWQEKGFWNPLKNRNKKQPKENGVLRAPGIPDPLTEIGQPQTLPHA